MPQGGVAAAEQRLCSGGTTGRGVLGLGAAIVWRMRCGGPRAVLIGRRSVLGVRAWDGNLAGDLGVTVARAESAEGTKLPGGVAWSVKGGATQRVRGRTECGKGPVRESWAECGAGSARWKLGRGCGLRGEGRWTAQVAGPVQ